MVGDNLAAQCQTNTRSAVCFLMVQALENTKDLFRGSGMKANAIVPNRYLIVWSGWLEFGVLQ